MADDNYNHIKQAFQKILLEQGLQNRQQELIKLRNKLANFLEVFNQATQELKAVIEDSVGVVEGQKTTSQTTKRYRAVKAVQERGYALDEKLKQGYVYIDQIRESLTGQHITYQVGFEDNGKLIEGEMDLLQILKNSTLDVETKSRAENTAKLRITKTPDLSQIQNRYQQQIQQNTEGASSVFSAVYNYLTNTKGQTPKVNTGNAYEVYKVIVNQRDNKNMIPPPVDFELVDSVFAMVKRNNVAFYRGGDLEDLQIKYFGGSAPSLVTSASVKRVLKKTIELFDKLINNSGPNQSIINGFVNLFTQKQNRVYTETEKIALIKAKNVIRQRLSGVVL